MKIVPRSNTKNLFSLFLYEKNITPRTPRIRAKTVQPFNFSFKKITAHILLDTNPRLWITWVVKNFVSSKPSIVNIPTIAAIITRATQ